MGETAIEWADVVWNPVTGCRKKSEGCRNCYAKRLHDMRHAAYLAGKTVPAQYAQPFEVVQLHTERLEMPLRWKAPKRVFVNSMSDLFHEAVPDGFIEKVFEVMRKARQHTFMILTKRAERMAEWCQERTWRVTTPDGERIKSYLPNVWLGVSVEDAEQVDARIPRLLETPAAVRFASCEPLLGPVSLMHVYEGDWEINALEGFENAVGHETEGCPKIDWVIVGGESGEEARPMHPGWARLLRDQCQEAHVPFFFKQWGEWSECRTTSQEVVERYAKDSLTLPNGDLFFKVGKAHAGRKLDGREWNERPEVKRG